MKTKALFFVFIFFVIFFMDCKKERHSCPSCSEIVTWNSYGGWVLQSEGGNGFSDGKDPINIVSDCGWALVEDVEVNGQTFYAVSSCDEGVLFVWMNDKFSVVQLQEGWTGSTKEGIKLGDDISKFLEKYPYFEYYPKQPPSEDESGDHYFLEYDSKYNYVFASFYPDGKLNHLYIIKHN